MAIAGLYKIFDHWHQQGTVHIISDTHFGDEELRAGFPDRPTDEDIVKSINAKVGRKDTLIILGDVGSVDLLRQLRGYKVLIMGNHDAGRSTYERQIITQQFFKNQYTKQQVLDLTKILFSNCKYSIDESDEIVWEITADNCLFDEVYEGPLMISEKLILSHEPVDVPWAFNLHGHDHTGRKSDERHFNVCADVIDYTPLNFNQFMKSGALSKIETIHRQTITLATKKSRKKKKKNK